MWLGAIWWALSHVHFVTVVFIDVLELIIYHRDFSRGDMGRRGMGFVFKCWLICCCESSKSGLSNCWACHTGCSAGSPAACRPKLHGQPSSPLLQPCVSHRELDSRVLSHPASPQSPLQHMQASSFLPYVQYPLLSQSHAHLKCWQPGSCISRAQNEQPGFHPCCTHSIGTPVPPAAPPHRQEEEGGRGQGSPKNLSATAGPTVQGGGQAVAALPVGEIWSKFKLNSVNSRSITSFHCKLKQPSHQWGPNTFESVGISKMPKYF